MGIAEHKLKADLKEKYDALWKERANAFFNKRMEVSIDINNQVSEYLKANGFKVSGNGSQLVGEYKEIAVKFLSPEFVHGKPGYAASSVEFDLEANGKNIIIIASLTGEETSPHTGGFYSSEGEMEAAKLAHQEIVIAELEALEDKEHSDIDGTYSIKAGIKGQRMSEASSVSAVIEEAFA